MTLYHAYGRVVSSDIPLPELPVTTVGEADIELTWNALDRTARGPWTVLWRFSSGEPWVSTSRANGLTHLRFSKFADCAVSPRHIAVCRRGHAAQATLRHLVLDQALPLVLAARGCLVVHASAVTDGTRAFVIAGTAGAGKSTLAALLARTGLEVLADDGVVIERVGGGRVVAVPSYPGLRLYSDSAIAADLVIEGGTDVAEYSRKLRFFPSRRAEDAVESIPLSAIYVLHPSVGRVSIQALSQRDAAIAVLAQSYRLDPGDSRALVAELDRIIAIAPPAWRLSYPRDLLRAAEVVSALLSHAASLP
jgi:hypothetical protein